MHTVTRAFAWQGVRIFPRARILTQPAGPPGGLISRTTFWAKKTARILAPRALHPSGVPGTRSQIVGWFLGPKSGTQNQASREGCDSLSRAP